MFTSILLYESPGLGGVVLAQAQRKPTTGDCFVSPTKRPRGWPWQGGGHRVAHAGRVAGEGPHWGGGLPAPMLGGGAELPPGLERGAGVGGLQHPSGVAQHSLQHRALTQ